MADRAPVEIRPLTHDDIDAVNDVTETVAAEGRWIGREAPIDIDEARGRMEAVLAGGERAAIFVATVAGEIVGTLSIRMAPNDVADLGMQVLDAWRGRGVGSALLARAIDWARRQGAHKVALQMWPHNERARALYEKHGFVEEGLLRRHYRRKDGSLWDAVVMGLVLDTEAPGPA